MSCPPSASIEKLYREYQRLALNLLHVRRQLAQTCLKHGDIVDTARLREAFDTQRLELEENLGALEAGQNVLWFDLKAECERLGVQMVESELKRYQGLLNENWESQEMDGMLEPRMPACSHCGR